MLTPNQIKRRALNRYPDFLHSLCTGESFFPLTVFGAGLAKSRDFEADRTGIRLLQNQSKENTGFGFDITWRECNFRRLGAQRVPASISFRTEQDYVCFLRKETEVSQFQADFNLIRTQFPELCAWVESKPLKVIAYSGAWDGLLQVCAYLRDKPRPNCYIRELPVVVDTKFIENHKGILSELLPIVAPQTVCTDRSTFEARFGFRTKQPLVRMRFLDKQLAVRYGSSVDDFATPLDKFCNLPFRSHALLVVENEMTFLTLPPLADTIAIYGAGDAAALLRNVTWVDSCKVFYWGDLDVHGFEILSTLRYTFNHVSSVLMDEMTLERFLVFAVSANSTDTKAKLALNSSELAIYKRLLEENILLEQERIPNEFSTRRLKEALDSPGRDGIRYTEVLA
jgi:hypothetical protein